MYLGENNLACTQLLSIKSASLPRNKNLNLTCYRNTPWLFTDVEVGKKGSLAWAGALAEDGGGGHRCMRWMAAEAWPPAAVDGGRG
jgi:hypothetical protein